MMFSPETFLTGLMITSTLTGLATEGVKKIMTERNKTYKANTLAGVVTVILSAAIGGGYIVMTNTEFTAQIGVCLIAYMFLSWLCAMVGYDKVIQTVKQFKNK